MSNLGPRLPFEESVDDVLDSAPCGFISTRPDGTITQVNSTFLSWTGYAREALLAGQRFHDLLTDSARILYEAHFAPLLRAQGFVKEIACQIKRDNQEPLQVLVNSSITLDSDGQPLCIRMIIFDATDRMKDDDELRRVRNEAQQLAAIVTASGDAIMSLGLDLVVRTWNPGATQLYGYTQEEAVGRTIDALIVPEDQSQERNRIYDIVCSGRRAVIKDTLRRRKDGSLAQVEITASPICDADGSVSALSAIHRDIAEYNAAGEALRRSEVRYRRLFEAAHDGVLILDPKTRKIIDTNPFMSALLSYTRDQMIGKELYQIGFYADAEASRNMFETLKAERHVRYESLPLQNLDGKVREVEVVANLYDENGHSVIQCKVRDIKERKQAEVQLKLSEAKLQLGLEVAGTGLGAMDYQNGTITLDPTAASFFALPANQKLPRAQVHARFHPEDKESILAKIAEALQPAGDGIMSIEHRIVRPDRSVMWVSARKHIEFSKTPDGLSSPLSGLLAVHDITERKQAETELRQSHDTYLRLIENNPFGIYLIDADFRMVQVSASVQKSFGTIEPLLGRDFAEVLKLLWHEPTASEIISRFRHTLQTGEPHHSKDMTGMRANRDGEESYDWQIERVNLPNGQFGIVCYFYDLTERKQLEEHIKLLMGEVNHRAKNLLAVVQAVARQTARTGDPATFAVHLTERIRGLAASQDLLVKNQWTHIAISELVQAQLSHFSDLIGTRVLLDGPPISLSPSAAQGIGMALHELATNAVKYGALSNTSGRVHISWAHVMAAKPEFTLEWLEEGGPEVEPPSHKGFGNTVIGRMVESSVDGKVDLEFRATGLCWKLTAPLVDLWEGRDHEQ